MIEIDLSGKQGNAFAIIGNARSLAKQIGYHQELIDQIILEMCSDDYQHLINRFEYYFGEYVQFINKDS